MDRPGPHPAGRAACPPVSGAATVRAAGVRAAVALAAPLAVGLAVHHPEYGALASLGGLFGVLAATAPARRTRLRTVTACLLLGAAGAALGGLVDGRGWTAFGVLTALALLSGMLSSLGRTASLAGLMLLLNAVLAAGVPPSTSPWWLPPLLIAGGGLLVLALCAPTRLQGARAGHVRTAVPAPTAPTVAAGEAPVRRLRVLLSSPAPWGYGLRLALCVGLAEALVVLMPYERAYWVPVTVVFVLKPDLGSVLSRSLLRAAGTAAGLLAAVAVFAAVPRGWWEVPVLVLLGALLPVLSRRGYGFQTAAVTPVILLLSDLGNLEGAELVGQLMSDSLIGCAIALAFGHFLWPGARRTDRTPPVATAPRRTVTRLSRWWVRSSSRGADRRTWRDFSRGFTGGRRGIET
ncbi:FUSC family protein [Streptomyces sp. NPDC001586]|uniref:FUSC family protein n=1 Tax=unclassified Streptomyces TaxID=2593676 RepID=UPI003324F47D